MSERLGETTAEDASKDDRIRSETTKGLLIISAERSRPGLDQRLHSAPLMRSRKRGSRYDTMPREFIIRERQVRRRVRDECIIAISPLFARDAQTSDATFRCMRMNVGSPSSSRNALAQPLLRISKLFYLFLSLHLASNQ